MEEESMSKRNQGEGRAEPAIPIVVNVGGEVAGLAVREGRRFRFMSAHPGFDLLDGSRFTRPEQISNAARKLARAARG
jgi:hypothetical protein